MSNVVTVFWVKRSTDYFYIQQKFTGDFERNDKQFHVRSVQNLKGTDDGIQYSESLGF
jgi:hypothetical protein